MTTKRDVSAHHDNRERSSRQPASSLQPAALSSGRVEQVISSRNCRERKLIGTAYRDLEQRNNNWNKSCTLLSRLLKYSPYLGLELSHQTSKTREVNVYCTVHLITHAAHSEHTSSLMRGRPTMSSSCRLTLDMLLVPSSVDWRGNITF